MSATTTPSEVPTRLQTCLHFIGGEYVASASGETFANLNPATGEVLGQIAKGDARDVDRAVQAARQAFESGPWARMTVRERCRILQKVGDLILERQEELARLESLDSGKPISESLTGDIPRSAWNFQFFAEYAPAQSEDCYTVDASERHFVVREPLGVAALITPWNLPLYLATWKIAPCLAMGNSCVLKPAEWTPMTATVLGEIMNEAGVPPGVFNVVHGFGAGGTGEALTTHPAVSAISFTGETSTGKAIMRNAADGLKKVSFELGGKGANILFADADLDTAIETSVRAAYRNQGEICLAGSRLLVQDGIYEEVIERLKTKIAAIRVGDPLNPQTSMGAIISREQMEKVLQYIEIGKSEAKLVMGGERLDGPGNFITPALFRDVAADARIAQDEIFGPVLPVIRFRDEAEAIAIANSTRYGLSTSIWSRDVHRCHRMAAAIRAGLVWVNCWFARDLRTPFGGMKASGLGREGGRYSLEYFSEAKTVTYRYQPE
jgi:aminomuconate-semialdehyde/2-hydroxymuconate-6-semialdehyde dehydrogenase